MKFQMYFKINFIIFLSLSILEIFNKKKIDKNKETNYYIKERERENKIKKEKNNSQYNNKIKNELNIFLYSNNEHNIKKSRKKKVGIISLKCNKNVGNNLLKFAIFIKLKELGVEPYIVGKHMISDDISFLKRTIHPRIIKNFDEIKKNDYDILMVNSDQTWRQWSNFYDVAFLNFSKDWEIPKFIYGASIGLDYWGFSKETDKIAKFLLKNFTGISFREMSTIKFAKKYLGINSIFVLDPTMLINKKYYINIINNYKIKNNINNCNEYILTYKLDIMENMESFIKTVQYQLNYTINNIILNGNDYVEKFLYGIYYCKAVITNSYHATLFSIIFNKPFIVFLNNVRGNERFKTIKEVYGIKDRFFTKMQNPNLNLLTTPLIINYTNINFYRKISIEYLKKNLNVM